MSWFGQFSVLGHMYHETSKDCPLKLNMVMVHGGHVK